MVFEHKNNRIKKVAVLGLGYVGLPTLVAISQNNKYDAVGFDISPSRIGEINTGVDPIGDKDVSAFLQKNKLNVSNDPDILSEADVFIVAVPTPVDESYLPNYQPVMDACQAISKYIRNGCHVVIESTVNPGTCEEILLPILELKSGLVAGKDFNIAHCPERINPGDNIWTIYTIPRNIGSLNLDLNSEIADFYRSILPKSTIHEVSSLKVAEATKIVENTFRDINIAYVNELAQSFDAMNIDVVETINGAANKPFGFMPHYPGAGVGGHCIAVDPYYLIRRASQSGFDHEFLKVARKVNNSMPEYTVRRLMEGLNQLGLPLKDTKVLLLGLSYKPNIADTRESPALEIAQSLLEKGAVLSVYDPYLTHFPSNLSQFIFSGNLSEALKNVSAVVLATAHDIFVQQLAQLLPNSSVEVVVDGRNCLDASTVKKADILYMGIGRS